MNGAGRALRCVLLGALAGMPSSRAHAAEPADAAVRAAAAEPNPSGRLYRVGLDVGHRLMLSSSAPYRILDPATGRAAWRETFTGETAVLAEGGPEGEPASIYRIQVGAFATEEAAERERQLLEQTFAAPAVVRYVPDRGSWRVRIGGAADREGLAPLLAKLRDAGRKGIWVAEEPREAPAGVTLRLVDAAWESRLSGARRLVALPSPGALLEVQGKSYRGAIEFRIDGAGRVRAINWIEMESYLRGVVPAELGPEVWPQLEALKAQAVAARTYAVVHEGQFGEDGFDICASPRCQAYGGASAEHPLSDRAVAETAHRIATWQGKPIDALYTATCGGHTEDAKEIFPEQAAPYLVGVPCRAEVETLARTRRVVKGATPVAFSTEHGEDVTREVWLLVSAGILDGRSPSHLARELSRPVSGATLRAWTSALASRAGLPAPTGAPIAPNSLPAAARAIAADLGWSERAAVLLADADVEAVLREPKAAALPPDERRVLAYLVAQGALRPAPDGRWPLERAPSGGTLAGALARIGEVYEALELEEGTFVGLDDGALLLARGKSNATFPLASSPRLFTAAGPRAYPVAALQLWPGDRVRFHRGAEGRVGFLELRPPAKGLSDDRSASVYAWEVRKTARELTEAIDRRVSVGSLQDLVVRRRGVSGRIVELEVVGSAGSAVVKGFDVRQLLDLRESLTVIELQRDRSGRVASAVFAGKGWGHGVGLCQVGAYGMAQRGADYKSILTHYYSGIALEESGPPDAPRPGTP